ncbi:hypothetical protein CCH79_00000298, partial [Gambusia affinis]
MERERQEKERQERERQEQERQEKERLERETLERQERERQEKEAQAERERMERERQEQQERTEREVMEREKAERERLEKEQQEQLDREQQDWERGRRISNAAPPAAAAAATCVSAEHLSLPVGLGLAGPLEPDVAQWGPCCQPQPQGKASSLSDDAGAALAAALSGAAGAKTEARGNGPLPGGGGLMEEMSALLARRRRIAEKGSSPEPDQRSEEGEINTTPKMSACSTPDMPRKPWERTNTMNGSKSPVIGRPKSTPTPTASLSANGVPTESVDYDRLK